MHEPRHSWGMLMYLAILACGFLVGVYQVFTEGPLHERVTLVVIVTLVVGGLWVLARRRRRWSRRRQAAVLARRPGAVVHEAFPDYLFAAAARSLGETVDLATLQRRGLTISVDARGIAIWHDSDRPVLDLAAADIEDVRESGGKASALRSSALRICLHGTSVTVVPARRADGALWPATRRANEQLVSDIREALGTGTEAR